jgi:signal transduction histidine kinase
MSSVLQKLRPDSTRLTLLLLLVVLAPSACLLWFMSQAAQNERLALRQKLTDAYRIHLAAMQQRLEVGWKQTAQDLDTQAAAISPAVLFDQVVLSNLADAVICLDSSNRVLYPSATGLPELETTSPKWNEAAALEHSDPVAAADAFAQIAKAETNVDLVARALQAQARSLARSGQTPAAIDILLGPLAEPHLQHARDSQGRLVVPNAQLMAAQLLDQSAPKRADAVRTRLRETLTDYTVPGLAAPQRRFLMHELGSLSRDNSEFPTLPAEDLAASFLNAGPIPPAEPGFHPTALPGVWRFDSANGRVITLHRIAPLSARLSSAASLQGLPPETTFYALAPGTEPTNALLSLPAGPTFPGWRLALAVNEPTGFDASSVRRVSSYVWVGAFMVAGIAALGLLALSLVRRQIALTRLRNDLVANVTHELKTPLASMRLLVDTLLDSNPLHEPTARDYLQLIARENNRLSRLIDNFLAFSRMERNKRAFDFADVPAGKIATDAATAVRERFDVSGCSFQLNLPAELPIVRADADAMVTALVNLLDNAYKYSGDTKEITLSAGTQNGTVYFSVQDNGIGLAARETKRIFKRFYQVDRHQSPAGGGCGLGLSIVKLIVSAHHGDVHVDSQPGHGSNFVISLPLDASHKKPSN